MPAFLRVAHSLASIRYTREIGRQTNIVIFAQKVAATSALSISPSLAQHLYMCDIPW